MATRQRPRSTRLLVVVLVSVSLAVITLDYREGEYGPSPAWGGRPRGAGPDAAGRDHVTAVGNFFSGLAHLPSLPTRSSS